MSAVETTASAFTPTFRSMLESFGVVPSDEPSEFSCPTTKKSRGRRKGSLGKTALEIREAVEQLTDRYERMTVRQVFYQLETMGVVEKTEGGYRQVQRQVLEMRRADLLAWDFITDGTRWQRKPASYSTSQDFMETVCRGYRRDLWQRQGVRIEVWLEKDALADLVVDVTSKWDVPLMVSRGQSSATFLYTAARAAERAFKRDGTETMIFALYDYDAGGERASDTIKAEIPKYAPECAADDAISFERLGVTISQIVHWGLPTRPPKKTDPQAAKWGDRPAVELDAIPPERLIGLVEDAIVGQINAREWEVEQAIEKQEREGLRTLASAWKGRS